MTLFLNKKHFKHSSVLGIMINDITNISDKLHPDQKGQKKVIAYLRPSNPFFITEFRPDKSII